MFPFVICFLLTFSSYIFVKHVTFSYVVFNFHFSITQSHCIAFRIRNAVYAKVNISFGLVSLQRNIIDILWNYSANKTLVNGQIRRLISKAYSCSKNKMPMNRLFKHTNEWKSWVTDLRIRVKSLKRKIKLIAPCNIVFSIIYCFPDVHRVLLTYLDLFSSESFIRRTYKKQQLYSVSFVSWPAAEIGLTLSSKKVWFVLYIPLAIVPPSIKIKILVGLHERTQFRGRKLPFYSYENSRQTV